MGFLYIHFAFLIVLGGGSGSRCQIFWRFGKGIIDVTASTMVQVADQYVVVGRSGASSRSKIGMPCWKVGWVEK
jgi:hypothetical protein